MPYYKFDKDDLFYNRVKTYPKVNFKIVRGPGDTLSTTYYNNRPELPGQFSNAGEAGYISLYELNIDRITASVADPEWPSSSFGHPGHGNNYAFPFLTKDSSMHAFSTVSTTGFHGFNYGDTLTSSYPLSASIHRDYYAENSSRKHIFALKSNLDRGASTSPHFPFTGSDASIGIWDKSVQEINMISVPSIFYGSAIQRGSVSLKFYITGTLAAEVSDIKQNGELIQIGPTGSQDSGSVAGIILYGAGIFLLTGSWDVDTIERDYLSMGAGDLVKSKWIHFGHGIQPGHTASGNVTASSFDISFRGINYIPTMTMLAHAPINRLNHSNNPTYLAHSSSWDHSASVQTITSSTLYKEYDKKEINNIVYSDYNSVTGSFKKTTFISQVRIYDEDMNCIGIAKVAKPVKKTPDREFTFKLKVDF